MGLRGPLPREQQNSIATDAPEAVATPRWLTKSAKRIFRSLVADLTAARVPIKAVDAHAIAMAAHCIQQAQEWAEQQTIQPPPTVEWRKDCAALVARFQRDAQEWLNVIGGTPKSRAQMGLKGKEAPKVTGALAVIAARRQHTA